MENNKQHCGLCKPEGVFEGKGKLTLKDGIWENNPISIQSVGYGFGAGVGWAMAIILIAGLRKKMGYSNIPQPFQGVAITMIITGIMAMAFMGFAGMVAM